MSDFMTSFSTQWLQWAMAASWQLALWFVLVATAALLASRASARLRYVLWTLVLLKAVLPPSLGGAWAIGSWGVQPAMEMMQDIVVQASPPANKPKEIVIQAFPPAFEPKDIVMQASPPAFESRDEKVLAVADADAAEDGRTKMYLLIVWAAGVFVFLSVIAFRYWRMSRRLSQALTVEEGPLRCVLEQLSLRLNIKRTPELLLSEHVSSPFLMGLFRARIVLPMALPTQISPEEMEHVLLHELTHYKRHDLWVGWAQVFVQALYWFHPLVWLAGAQLRHERECACDEEALSSGVAAPAEYGKSLLQVLLSSRGHSAAAMGFLGIFERNTRIQRRLEEIMSNENRTRKFGWGSWMFVGLFVFVCLPMATKVKAQTGAPAVADTGSQNFVDDPQLIGSWQAVDFVSDPTQFKVNAKQWKGDLYLKEITVYPGGKTSGPWTWTKGILWHPQDRTESKYEIRETDGAEYLFMPWMSGDVTQRGRKPQYYVLKKVATSWQTTANTAEAKEKANLEAINETTVSTRAETAAAKGDLMEAIGWEMYRVLLRAREGNVWTDKIDLGPIYEKYKAAARPSNAQLQKDYDELMKQMQTIYDPQAERDEYWPLEWRIYHLASLMAQDLKKMDEAAQHLDKALELYPNTPYSDPAKQSKYQHLINQRAGLIWDVQGMEAAEKFALERLQNDPKLKAFYAEWWREQFKKHNQTEERLQSFNQKAIEAQIQKERQQTSSTTAALSAEQTAKQFIDLVTAKEFDKAAAMFDATMKAALPVDQLRQTWEQTVSSIGEFEQITSSSMMKIQGYDVLEARGKFARSDMILRVSVSADEKIAGFYILNAQPVSSAPSIISTSPEIGAKNVNPDVYEITVTFHTDMDTGGFSWTGGGPEYPPIAEGKKPFWRDSRTCVLPVKLEAGHYYRVGINSTSYQNFRSAQGVPAKPASIYFTTHGAPAASVQKLQKPAIVKMEPANFATGVPSTTKELRVTFSVPMGGGFSWTGGGENYPTIVEGQKPYWTEDKMTCVLPVQLKPNWTYRLGLNSPSHKNFMSEAGVPLEPMIYTFSTGQ